MIRLLLLLLLIIFATTSKGQRVEQKIQTEINFLKSLKVDTFLIYKLTCVGSLIAFDTCGNEEPQYLFWKQNSSYFLKKIDYCKKYIQVNLDTINPLSFYFLNKNKIVKEKILMPTYVESKKGDILTEISSTIDHTCFYEMNFCYNGKKVFKTVSDFDLTFIKFDNGRKNMYYNYNQQAKLKKLIDLMVNLIKQLETGNKFETQ